VVSADWCARAGRQDLRKPGTPGRGRGLQELISAAATEHPHHPRATSPPVPGRPGQPPGHPGSAAASRQASVQPGDGGGAAGGDPISDMINGMPKSGKFVIKKTPGAADGAGAAGAAGAGGSSLLRDHLQRRPAEQAPAPGAPAPGAPPPGSADGPITPPRSSTGSAAQPAAAAAAGGAAAAAPPQQMAVGSRIRSNLKDLGRFLTPGSGKRK
jgi:hypothetical protein